MIQKAIRAFFDLFKRKPLMLQIQSNYGVDFRAYNSILIPDWIVSDVKQQTYDKLNSDIKFEKKAKKKAYIIVEFQISYDDLLYYREFNKPAIGLEYVGDVLYYLHDKSDYKALQRNRKLEQILND